MKKCWLLGVIICLLGNSAQAQTVLPDSIESKFANLPRDSFFIDKINGLSTNYLRTNPGLSRTIAIYATELAPGIKYVKGYAQSLRLIGNSYWTEGAYEFAQNYYLLAARQYQSLGDSIGLGQIYNNIGEVYKKMGDLDKALEYLTQSVQLKRKDTYTNSLTLYNIGELYLFKDQISLAEKFIEQALSLSIKANNQKATAYSYDGLGIIQTKRKKYLQAIDYFERAEKIWKELGEIRLLIQTYQDFSDVYRELRQFDEAEKYLILSKEMSSLIRVPDLIVNNHLKFFKLDSARGKYSQALAHLYRHTILKDSVYNLAKSEQIARLQVIYESENRERENRQLKIKEQFRESQVKFQRQIIVGISIGLFVTGIMAWLLYSQRHKVLSINKILQEKNNEIGTQKLAIEMQATALIKLNEELQELNKNLEARIDQRTKQLTIQNKRLTEYTFVNAHKLRAPVSSILGLISLIDQNKPEEYATILAHLKTCGNQLDMITRQISKNLEDGIVEH